MESKVGVFSLDLRKRRLSIPRIFFTQRMIVALYPSRRSNLLMTMFVTRANILHSLINSLFNSVSAVRKNINIRYKINATNVNIISITELVL